MIVVTLPSNNGGNTGIKDGQVLANHVFWTTHTNGETKLIIKTDETELAEHNLVQDLKKRGCSGPCCKLWLASMPDPIAPVQLLAIKQAELYNKWQQYLPEQYRDIMCPKPPDDVLEKVAADKRQKGKHKRTAAASAAETTTAAAAAETTELFAAVQCK